MIPELHKSQVISTAAQFVQCITKAYGAEIGMDLWNKISSVLDPSVKGELFFAMVAGEINHQLVIKLAGPAAHGNVNKIGLIKLIREHAVTKPGLKEAKDLVDALTAYGRPITILVSPHAVGVASSAVEYLGFQVG